MALGWAQQLSGGVTMARGRQHSAHPCFLLAVFPEASKQTDVCRVLFSFSAVLFSFSQPRLSFIASGDKRRGGDCPEDPSVRKSDIIGEYHTKPQSNA